MSYPIVIHIAKKILTQSYNNFNLNKRANSNLIKSLHKCILHLVIFLQGISKISLSRHKETFYILDCKYLIVTSYMSYILIGLLEIINLPMTFGKYLRYFIISFKYQRSIKLFKSCNSTPRNVDQNKSLVYLMAYSKS